MTTIQSAQQKSFTQVLNKNYEMLKHVPGLDQNTSVVESREM